jgi:hypothetical protein
MDSKHRGAWGSFYFLEKASGPLPKVRISIMLREPHGSCRDGAVDLPSDDAARAHAERIIREIQADGDDDESDLSLVVQSSHGATLLILPFS